jgi:hypothetical protein
VKPLPTPPELAREFLAAHRGLDAWEVPFIAWCGARGLTVDQAHAVKVAVLRERVFGAVERGGAGARRRRRG